MVRLYSKLVLKKDCFLEFKIINELKWTNVFFVDNGKRVFIGSEEYETIIEKFVRLLNKYEQKEVIQIIAFFETYNTFYYIGNNSFIIQDTNAKTIFEFVVEDLKGIYFEE